MEGIAGFEAAPQKILRPARGGRSVHHNPLGGKPGGPLETPAGVSLRHLPADALVTERLEEPPAHGLADLGFVVGDQIARDAAHDLW